MQSTPTQQFPEVIIGATFTDRKDQQMSALLEAHSRVASEGARTETRTLISEWEMPTKRKSYGL